MPRIAKQWRLPSLLMVSAAAASIIMLCLPTVPMAEAIAGDRSNYLAVTARSGRGGEEAVWIFDTRTEELIVVAWDRNASSVRALDRREVSRDLLRVEAGR
ncbi:MAG: hypothetical protein GY894_04880 [Planctomycetes bacterium]|jgi:hypothetical protein|nr:hypothetical protein [Planctomycetota bacterium]MCP4838680.1 hypothetical protein [Planctomycetota bacterium]